MSLDAKVAALLADVPTADPRSACFAGDVALAVDCADARQPTIVCRRHSTKVIARISCAFDVTSELIPSPDGAYVALLVNASDLLGVALVFLFPTDVDAPITSPQSSLGNVRVDGAVPVRWTDAQTLWVRRRMFSAWSDDAREAWFAYDSAASAWLDIVEQEDAPVGVVRDPNRAALAAAYAAPIEVAERAVTRATDPEIVSIAKGILAEREAADHCNRAFTAEIPAEKIAALREAIAIAPTFRRAHVLLCNALGDEGDRPAMREAATNWTSARPGDAASHVTLGAALAQLGAMDDAIAALRGAIEFGDDGREAIEMEPALDRFRGRADLSDVLP